MLTVWCSVQKDGKIKHNKKISISRSNLNEEFIECLSIACRAFDIETPMWHTKHTKQLNMFRKITFLKDDFIDKMPYDKFIIEILDIE